ncbi:hypothetical protein GALMADRAFT_1251906 [Galerina marginata CBS 339.88]|uniref:Uncharacterized protein n=1 Tax=Galerina marginata (strain CBS 339.88) TaxID=685588 RepID=A0A067T5V1_GALM3|nr:hypothetical protein GALMADRAFT_1251906 [Galerina marginata CBS 339.88]
MTRHIHLYISLTMSILVTWYELGGISSKMWHTTFLYLGVFVCHRRTHPCSDIFFLFHRPTFHPSNTFTSQVLFIQHLAKRPQNSAISLMYL